MRLGKVAWNRSCHIKQKARGVTLAQRRRWVPASEQTLISGSLRGCLSLIATSYESAHDCDTPQSDAFAASGFHLASGIFDFDCGIRVKKPLRDFYLSVMSLLANSSVSSGGRGKCCARISPQRSIALQ